MKIGNRESSSSLVIELAFPLRPTHNTLGLSISSSCPCGSCGCSCPFEEVPGPTYGTLFVIDLGIAAAGSAALSGFSNNNDDD